MTIVISRPIDKYEAKPATKITNDWAQDVADSMLCGGLSVYDLSGTFNREQLEYVLADPEVDMFVHYGHGLNHCLLGSDNSCILDDFNLDLLQNKVVVSINCDSAEDFGVECVEAGALAYIGYDEKVFIKYNQQKNPYAGFKESNNAWNTLMGNGDPITIGQAFNEMVKQYNDWKTIYITNGYPEIAECLDRSLQSLLILGDETVYLPIQEPVDLLDYHRVYPE
jgi:hypothetical protein